MEEKTEVKVEKQKSNKGLVIALVVIIAVLIGVICFLVTSKDLLNKYSTATGNKNNNSSKVVKNENKADGTTAMTADEKYEEYLTRLASQIRSRYNNQDSSEISYTYVGGNLPNGSEADSRYTFLFKINEKLELTIDSDSTYYSSGTKMTTTQEAVKVTDNVVSMFLIRNGQTAARALWIIKTDGNIYRIKYKRSEAAGVDAGYYDIHNLEKYEGKNIVYIAETALCHREACSGYDGPTFIDIEGNIYGADELVQLK